MKITETNIKNYCESLKVKELAHNTILKYARDAKKFAKFIKEKEITKSIVIEFKASIMKKYKPVSVNSILAAINSFLKFLELNNLCVSKIKIQRHMLPFFI